MRPHPLFLAIGMATVPLSLSATPLTEAAAVPAHDHDRVVVTATRTERLILDVPNTVDVIDRERMDQLLVRDISDLFRYEPGITVTSSPGRFGIGDIRVRGLGGNRVRILTDGVPVPDAFSIGSFSNAGRNFVDPDTLKRVEVVRGPTSSLYGSDALGGVVAFITRDPADYLDDGRESYLGLRIGAESDWDGFGASATGAFAGERWSGLVSANHRQGRETENMGEDGSIGAARTRPNPQRRDGRSVLSKLVFEPGGGQRFRLTVEGNEDSADTDMLASYGLQAMTGATNTQVLAADHQTRARVSLAHEVDVLDTVFADSLDWQLYRQDSETTQDTLEERLTATGVRERRERSFNYDQRSWGLQANLLKHFRTGDAEHALSWGIDLQRTRTRQKRDGLVTNLLTGATSNAMLPDVFPVRDFPVSRTDTAALYLQDEIVFADGGFRLVPAVRVDRYELEPELEPIFADDNPGIALSGLTKTQVSPKLGMVWRFQPDWSLFASYAHGFRAPPYDDVNIGFTNPMFGYTAIPNPDLKPETSRGVEAGVRHTGRALHASLTGYLNRYEDFIESLRFVGFNDEGLMVFQSQNVSEARIHGAELKLNLDLGALAGWEGWSMQGAAAWSRGEDRTLGVPLDSIDPLTGTLGIAYKADAWGAELIGRFVDGRTRVSSEALFQAPGHAVLDLYAHWRLSPNLRLDAGVRNLADRKYWSVGNLPGALGGGSDTLDRFTSPGRSLAVSLAVEF